LVNIAHSNRVTAPFFKLRNYASAVPQLDVVSVNELASMFEGVVVIRGDKLMAVRNMRIAAGAPQRERGGCRHARNTLIPTNSNSSWSHRRAGSAAAQP